MLFLYTFDFTFFFPMEVYFNTRNPEMEALGKLLINQLIE